MKQSLLKANLNLYPLNFAALRNPGTTEAVVRRALSPHSHTGFQDILLLTLQGIALFAVSCFLDSGLMYRLWSLGQQSESDEGPVVSQNTAVDPSVATEEHIVDELIRKQRTEHHALIVRHITKTIGLFDPRFSVDSISFSVSKAECFGLIGISGTGKTSVLRMLAGDDLVTDGEAYMQNITLTGHIKEWWGMVGYVPSNYGLLPTMTGREAIELFATLRGIHKTGVVVDSLISFVSLANPDGRVHKYSAGNKTLLSLSVAIIGLPCLLLLDLAEVDVSSRHKIRTILEVLKHHANVSTVLTCNNLDRYSSTCDRVAVMVAGRIECLGSLKQLRDRYARGFTITVYTFPDRKYDIDYQKLIAKQVITRFSRCTLVRSYNGSLEFRIDDPTLGWLEMFDNMHSIKRQFKFHEYYISDTTMQQIFLSLARKHAGLQVAWH